MILEVARRVANMDKSVKLQAAHSMGITVGEYEYRASNNEIRCSFCKLWLHTDDIAYRPKHGVMSGVCKNCNVARRNKPARAEYQRLYRKRKKEQKMGENKCGVRHNKFGDRRSGFPRDRKCSLELGHKGPHRQDGMEYDNTNKRTVSVSNSSCGRNDRQYRKEVGG